MLWAALSIAPEDGIPVPDLVAATGWAALGQLPAPRPGRGGQAIQIKRGKWRAATPDGDAP